MKDSRGLNPQCWVVTDGKIGMEIQCIGLAEALGFEPVVKRIQVRRPWRWLPPLWVPNPLGSLGPKKDNLAPPWPEVLIASGRQSIAVSIAIRRAAAGRCFTVQIQNPVVDPALFDVIVTPRHDRLQAPNVISTLGAMNRVTPARLAEAAGHFAPQWADMPRPLIAVVLGGNNKVFRFTKSIGEQLGRRLAELARKHHAGILVTPSRRTPPDVLAALSEALQGLSAQIWDGQGENPYLGYLALADAIVVTADSVNMVSEAATTGKPVYVVELPGGSRKFREFHTALREAGKTRTFEGRFEPWTYEPLRDTQDAAAAIHKRLAAWRKSSTGAGRAPAG
jgi:mitochondrial fission protein ELM1